jgi:hypothetical protein
MTLLASEDHHRKWCKELQEYEWVNFPVSSEEGRPIGGVVAGVYMRKGLIYLVRE